MSRPLTSVYLAARYGRRQELLRYRAELHSQGIEVTSRWLNSQEPGSDGLTEAQWADLAILDREDVERADALVLFAEEPGGGGSGGRHVEFGMALAWSKPVIVIGRREHLFHRLPEVAVVADWDGALPLLRRLKAGLAFGL